MDNTREPSGGRPLAIVCSTWGRHKTYSQIVSRKLMSRSTPHPAMMKTASGGTVVVVDHVSSSSSRRWDWIDLHLQKRHRINTRIATQPSMLVCWCYFTVNQKSRTSPFDVVRVSDT
jgi:hypothetical protein